MAIRITEEELLKACKQIKRKLEKLGHTVENVRASLVTGINDYSNNVEITAFLANDGYVGGTAFTSKKTLAEAKRRFWLDYERQY